MRDEEDRRAEAKADLEREALLDKLGAQLAQQPFAAWVRRGGLPDYPAIYRHLVDVCRRVARISAERPEIELGAEMGIQRQLKYMLGAYLMFVRARITYLQILSSMQRPDTAGGPADTPEKSPPQQSRPVRRGAEPVPPPAAPPLPTLEARLAEIDLRIADLKSLSEREPETAETRKWHGGILEKQRELIVDCGKRDQTAAAQLQAFPDAFEVVLGRVSASEFNASEVASYMTSVVEQVEDTARFVEAMRPAMDELLGAMPLAG